MKRAKKDQGGVATPVHLCDHQTVVVPMLGVLRIYTTAIDKSGRLWERWSDNPEGEWHEITPPTK